MRIVRYPYHTYRSLAPTLGRFSRSPWTGLESEIDRFFESALGEFAGALPTSRFPVDLYEDEQNTYVRAELPGVNRDEIGVEVVDGSLNLTAARKTPATEGQPEQSFTLSRSLSLPDGVQSDQIAATYENGVLTVTLPKQAEAKPKKVTVAVK